ncbi:MAG TPA: mandelate racemase/muconate lactonizing enzyme family protein [Bryobacteraceae bacterium]|jgi:L-alanine-DL-glutamate epimerase-like enolase superfamily enzyme|nr:mandelate racemase/muconate lactonizing enzyme family protein [Bryobacteraceae bacterium]
MPNQNGKVGRRALLQSSAAALGGALLGRNAEAEQESPVKNVNTHSSPSTLKITDLRVATVVKPGPSPCTIVRLDTNQGVYGLGEVRDGASATYALFLKSRLLNENPLRITYLFQKIKQFGYHGRQAGGVVAIEEALWDIAGKVYGVPIYQMLGGKFRDKIRIYADTTESDDPKVYAQRMKERKEVMGITWLKMDLGIEFIARTPGTVTRPSGLSPWEQRVLPHPFVATEVTDKGIDMLCTYVAAIREAVGMEIPLSMDHLGHLGVNSIIRLGKAYEKYNLAWMEDVIPWQYTEMLQHITAESPTPILTGEDIYLKEGFINLCEKHAVSKIHPDISTSGGILETHKIGDAAMEYGVPMAMHYAGLPIGAMASVHCAAATENFLACENHSLDVPWWQDLVEGIEKPIINKGFITVPDKPGLGITLNEDVVRRHLMPGTEYFAPTPQWDKERSADHLWSMAGAPLFPFGQPERA